MDIETVQLFCELLKAGLWEKDALLMQYGELCFTKLYKLAEEQSVIGLIAAGIEHVKDVVIPRDTVLSFVGNALMIEKRNMAMNSFIKGLFEKLYSIGGTPLLIKGQGIAQCYERPLWRSSGDVDILLDNKSYEYAKQLLSNEADEVEDEIISRLHQGYRFGPWMVELHGTLRTGLWDSLDNVVNHIQNHALTSSNLRYWYNSDSPILLPPIDDDVLIIFTHIVQHFYKRGIGLRQICDWCRLLWTFKGSINEVLLEERLREMRLITEWKSFGALAVDYLGVPVEAIPFYSFNRRWSRKAKRIFSFVLETGSFGHNRDNSYHNKHSFITRKMISFFRSTRDSISIFCIFPKDSIICWMLMIKSAVNKVINRSSVVLA